LLTTRAFSDWRKRFSADLMLGMDDILHCSISENSDRWWGGNLHTTREIRKRILAKISAATLQHRLAASRGGAQNCQVFSIAP
jgi:hypothetical protein